MKNDFVDNSAIPLRRSPPKGTSILRVLRQIPARRRFQSIGLLILMLLTSLAEVFSIAAILPFVSVLINPDSLLELSQVQGFLSYFSIMGEDDLLPFVTVLFVAASLISGSLRLFLAWMQPKFAHFIGTDLGIEMYRRALYQPYIAQLSRNSGDVIAAVFGKSSKLTVGLVLPLFVMCNGAILTILIFGALLLIDFATALGLISTLGALYGLAVVSTRNWLGRNGHVISEETSRSTRILQEGLGGARDVILTASQPVYIKSFSRSLNKLRQAMAENAFLMMAPRFGIESIAMVLLALFAFYLSQKPGGLEQVFPVLAAIILGLQRLLPVAQQSFNAWSQIRSAGPAIDDCLSYLELPLQEINAPLKTLKFEQGITLQDVSMEYEGGRDPALRNVSLSLKKGSSLGIIGPTGSGKSTLVDVLMGLLNPTSGAMIVDDTVIDSNKRRSWRRHVAHVPQAIFLTDDTIRSNIAFGIAPEDIDQKRLADAVAAAQLDQVISAFPKGLDTIVGERGSLLSGGQRQRVGIARALYQDAKILVLDEATSALDVDTERLVIEAIEVRPGNLTLVMIAHRVQTLRHCDLIVKMSDGKIEQTGTYDDIILSNRG